MTKFQELRNKMNIKKIMRRNNEPISDAEREAIRVKIDALINIENGERATYLERGNKKHDNCFGTNFKRYKFVDLCKKIGVRNVYLYNMLNGKHGYTNKTDNYKKVVKFLKI